jgi:hypothetical protein
MRYTIIKSSFPYRKGKQGLVNEFSSIQLYTYVHRYPKKLFRDFVLVNFLPKKLRKNMPEGQEGQTPLRGLNLGAAKRLLGV